MNKLATSLTLAAVIIFDVSGTNIPTAQLVSNPAGEEPHLSRHNSIAALEHVATPPIVMQEKSIDDSVLNKNLSTESIINHATKMETSTVTIAHHAHSISKAVLETIHDLHDGNLPRAFKDIHKIREEFNPELEKACSSCIGATGGLFSSLKEALISMKNRIFSSGSSNSEKHSSSVTETIAKTTSPAA